MRPPRHRRPVFDVAPVAGEVEPPEPEPTSASLPVEPPAPGGVRTPAPLFRPLKVYAFGPSRGGARGNLQSIAVRYEKLAPGPVGERISVVDYDVTRDGYYDPVDLDDPHIAINGGLDPCVSDPHFHQQMAYAVVSESLRRIELALGRAVRPIFSRSSAKASVSSAATPITTSFWYAVRRAPRAPYASTRSARPVSVVPSMRPTTGAAPT